MGEIIIVANKQNWKRPIIGLNLYQSRLNLYTRSRETSFSEFLFFPHEAGSEFADIAAS